MTFNQLRPALTISKLQARRFLLRHQHLLPPRQLKGKGGILSYIKHTGCIQYDPINVVGRNPDLVLQSRIDKYRPKMLEALLYQDRELLDGWDKVRSIYHVKDWPYFSRHRARMRDRYGDPTQPEMKAAPEILQTLREQGPLSSIDFKRSESVDWSWGQSSSLAKAALDVLYAKGEIGIDHKIGTRRVFNLIDRLIPVELLTAQDPNPTMEDYLAWHVLRRVGGLGLAHSGPSEYWGGILDFTRSDQRRAILGRLVELGELLPLSIQGLKGRIFFTRVEDKETLGQAKRKSRARPRAAILGALDNLLWDRNLVRWIFEFDYIWEVYKPVAKRKFGYYVLPILFEDCFIGRFEPVFDRKISELGIKNWWWEEGIQPDGSMEIALIECFEEFLSYLGAERLALDDDLRTESSLCWVSKVNEQHE